MLQHVVLRVHDGGHVKQDRVGRTVQLCQLQGLETKYVNIVNKWAHLRPQLKDETSLPLPIPLPEPLNKRACALVTVQCRVSYYLHLVEDLAPLRELGAVAPGLEVLGQRHLDR